MCKWSVSFFLLACLLFLKAGEASAESLSNDMFLAPSAGLPYGHLQPFRSDSCTLFPEGDLKDPVRWRHCCVEHDLQYWRGGSYQERWISDRNLAVCVREAGSPAIAQIMFDGVRLGGNPFVPTPWRWGYGWPKVRGYAELTEAEERLVRELIPKSLLSEDESF